MTYAGAHGNDGPPSARGARWESVNSVFRTAGFVWTSGRFRLERLVGSMQGALELSLALYMVQSVWLLFARSAWQFYAVLPAGRGARAVIKPLAPFSFLIIRRPEDGRAEWRR